MCPERVDVSSHGDRAREAPQVYLASILLVSVLRQFTMRLGAAAGLMQWKIPCCGVDCITSVPLTAIFTAPPLLGSVHGSIACPQTVWLGAHQGVGHVRGRRLQSRPRSPNHSVLSTGNHSD